MNKSTNGTTRQSTYLGNRGKRGLAAGFVFMTAGLVLSFAAPSLIDRTGLSDDVRWIAALGGSAVVLVGLVVMIWACRQLLIDSQLRINDLEQSMNRDHGAKGRLRQDDEVPQ